jgi:hypothetical protein
VPRHRLLNEDELRHLFGVPADREALARQFTLTPSDHDLVLTRRGDANRLGFAVQLALLRQSGRALAQVEEPIDPLVVWISAQIDVSAHLFADYARRHQTMTDHARQLASMLGLRPSTDADLPFMIEAAAQAAWTAHKPGQIVTAIVAALRSEKLILPALAVIERTGAAGRARARKRAADALLAGLTDEQLAKLDRLPVVDPELGGTPLAWLKAMPSAPKAGHVRDLLGKLQVVRAVGIPSDLASRLPEIRFRQFVREGQASPAYLLGRYTAHRRRATLVAVLFDLESRLTDAVLDMADRLIGGAFTRGKHAKEKTYAATTRDVGRLMRLFHDTIEALGAAQDSDRDAFAIVDETVGWAKLLRARPEVAGLADLAEENPLIRAADRYITIRKFVPALLEALTFKTARDNDPLLTAVALLRGLNQSGKREIPSDAPMPFRKEWRRLVVESGKPNRRLYEMAVLATLRNKLRSGDVWVERSSGYRRFDSYLLPTAAAPPVVSELGLPDTADAWLAGRSQELDERLKRFAQRLRRNQLDGVELRDERLHITPVKAATPAEATALAARLDALLPRVRITELLHEVNRATGFAAAFTNLRTGESCANENALLAAILADGTNLGLARMADASQGIMELPWKSGEPFETATRIRRLP